MSTMASVLILVGGLELILEFGSITFLMVSLLMAIANHKIRTQTNSSGIATRIAIAALSLGGALILYYELRNNSGQLFAIVFLYVVLAGGAYLAARNRERSKEPSEL